MRTTTITLLFALFVASSAYAAHLPPTHPMLPFGNYAHEDHSGHIHRGVSVGDSNFRFSDFSYADLIFAWVFNSDLSYADFSHANLYGATLGSTSLAYADFTNANMIGAYLGRAELGNAKLSEVDLRNASLIGAYFANVDLTDADLTGADLTGADLTGADLSNLASLQNAIFWQAYYNAATQFSAGFDPVAWNMIFVDDPQPIPEPATVFLLGTGLLSLVAYRRWG